MDRCEAQAEIRRAFLQACQERSDINEHLPMLYYLAMQCTDIVEFGVRFGVSTLAFMAALLNRPGAWYSGVDLVLTSPAQGIVARAVEAGCHAKLYQDDSRHVDFTTDPDLLFIDSDHTYEQMRAELRYADRVRKYLVMHDTLWATDMNRAIEEFLAEHPEWVPVYKTGRNNGLTVLERQHDADAST
jgi:cephalosporin hydroxylase